MTQPLLQAADLRGAARLGHDVLAGLSGLVDAMQARIAALPGPTGRNRGPGENRASSGILGLAGSGSGSGASAGTRIGTGAGASLRDVEPPARDDGDGLLAWLADVLLDADRHALPAPEREGVLAALNGVLGDHLAATDHRLAARMAMRRSGRPLVLERYALRSRLAGAGPGLLVLLHDLCMNDLQWHRSGHDHGEALAKELGYAPVYLHYNTGLSVSTNGRILAQMMERLYDAWPVPVERLVLLGHGMGGLVARSAIHHAAQIQRGGLRWPGRVNDLVCLGTPHQGTPLDGAGQGTGVMLAGAPHAAALAPLAGGRSAGIDDMRLGHIVSVPAGGPFPPQGDSIGLPDRTRCFAIAASLGPAAESAKSRRANDGVVPVASALGQHAEPERRLGFLPERQAVVADTGHLDLLASREVYELLRTWLG